MEFRKTWIQPNEALKQTLSVQRTKPRLRRTTTIIKLYKRVSLVAQWLRIRLAMQGKTPRAVEQLSPCATTTEPTL